MKEIMDKKNKEKIKKESGNLQELLTKIQSIK